MVNDCIAQNRNSSLRFANMFRRIFMLLSFLAAVSYSTSSFCFAGNAFSSAAIAAGARPAAAEGVLAPDEISSGAVLPARPESTELNVVEQTENVTVHYEDRSQAPVAVPVALCTEVPRKQAAFASSYVSYTELDNKFLKTVKSLQTLK